MGAQGRFCCERGKPLPQLRSVQQSSSPRAFVIDISNMISKAASVIAGMLIAHLYSDGFFPASHAAWSWGCTYYEGGDMQKRVDMAPDATDGPTCGDSTKLTCSCELCTVTTCGDST